MSTVPPSALNPGEIIRTSGKFGKPTKIPGKNYSKDEVVIRNADSGKGEEYSNFFRFWNKHKELHMFQSELKKGEFSVYGAKEE